VAAGISLFPRFLFFSRVPPANRLGVLLLVCARRACNGGSRGRGGVKAIGALDVHSTSG
jgi:hypothetical protein